MTTIKATLSIVTCRGVGIIETYLLRIYIYNIYPCVGERQRREEGGGEGGYGTTANGTTEIV